MWCGLVGSEAEAAVVTDQTGAAQARGVAAT